MLTMAASKFFTDVYKRQALEHVQALLPLAAADQLAHAGHQQVHGGDGFSVVVHAHVEGLDLLGVVVDERRAAEVRFAEVTLVLGWQVHAPGDGVLESLTALLEDVDGVGIGAAGEVAVYDLSLIHI